MNAGTIQNPHQPGTSENPTEVYLYEWFDVFGGLFMFDAIGGEEKNGVYQAVVFFLPLGHKQTKHEWIECVPCGFKFVEEIRK